jgi:hypothetical protein
VHPQRHNHLQPFLEAVSGLRELPGDLSAETPDPQFSEENILRAARFAP